MTRWEFVLTLCAAGIAMVLLVSSLTPERKPVLDPHEARSPLFARQESPPGGRDSHLDTRGTVNRWGRSAFAARVRPATFRPGQALGVLTSLQSSAFQSINPPGPDISPQFAGNCLSMSVNAANAPPGVATDECSTSAYAYGQTDYCSVQGIAGNNQNLRCSTLLPYCSTNPPAPNGGGGTQTGPAYCSVYGPPGGTGTNSCSAGKAGNPTCSTEAATQGGNLQSVCSVVAAGGTTGLGQCSTNSLSGFPPTGGNAFCSATTGSIPNNSQQSNGCSVTSGAPGGDGTTNQCSSDGSNNSACSVLIPKNPVQPTTTDSCSVSVVGTASKCTVVLNGGGNGQCSAFNPGVNGGPPTPAPTNTQCSVLNADGTLNTGPAGNPPLCSTPS